MAPSLAGGIRRPISKTTLALFTVMCAYLAFPLLDIPLLGLSLSAPIFFLIALEVFLKPPEAWLFRYRRWLGFAFFIWMGIFLAATINGLGTGGSDFDLAGLQSLIRYAYWLAVFVVSTYLASSTPVGPRLMRAISIAVVLAGISRLAEAALLGKIGAGTYPLLFTQNSYDWLFSTFSPFVMVSILGSAGPRRWLWGLGLVGVWIAAAINGSRGSWVAMSVGILALALLYAVSFPRYVLGLMSIVVLLGLFTAGLMLAPQRIVGTVSQRFATFQHLDEEKSFAVRQLMIQKGVRLFQESPLVGVGVSRWTRESTPLDLPPVLHYAPQGYFDSKSAHNSYVSFLAENGLVGAVPFTLLLLTLTIRGAQATIRLARQRILWPLAAYSGFVGMSVHLWVLSGLTNTATWFVYGLVAGGIEYSRRQGSV